MLLGPRSIAVSHRVVLCIAQFPGGNVGPVRVVRETEACSLCPDDSVLCGKGRYTPLRRDATNALRKRSSVTGIPPSPSVPRSVRKIDRSILGGPRVVLQSDRLKMYPCFDCRIANQFPARWTTSSPEWSVASSGANGPRDAMYAD